MKILKTAIVLTSFIQTLLISENILPKPVQNYFDAVKEKNLNKLMESFSNDAKILEVSRNIDGFAAIRTWAKNEVIGGKYTILETTKAKDGVSILLRFSPNGAGKGFKARYKFTVKNDKISYADLQYAD